MELGRLQPGTVRDVSPTVGTWLIVQGYAYPEMRRTNDDEFSQRPPSGGSYRGPDRRQS